MKGLASRPVFDSRSSTLFSQPRQRESGWGCTLSSGEFWIWEGRLSARARLLTAEERALKLSFPSKTQGRFRALHYRESLNGAWLFRASFPRSVGRERFGS